LELTFTLVYLFVYVKKNAFLMFLQLWVCFSLKKKSYLV